MTPEQRTKLGISELGDLQKLALADRAVHLCRQVAIASKHFEMAHQPDPSVKVVVTTTRGRGQIYFDDGGWRLPALYAFDLALEFWTRFIFGNGIAGEFSRALDLPSPSKKNVSGTSRISAIFCRRLAPYMINSSFVFLNLLKAHTHRVAQAIDPLILIDPNCEFPGQLGEGKAAQKKLRPDWTGTDWAFQGPSKNSRLAPVER